VPAPKHPLEADLAALHPASFGWAMACCKRRSSDAEEVLQQSYEKVFSGKATYDARSTLRTWLFGVIRITALEYWRFTQLRWLRFGSSDAANGNAPEAASDDASPSQRLASAQMAKACAEALILLPERQREVLHLVFYEAMAIREAAEIMQVSVGTAGQHYERGKARMRALLLERGIR
jgi:RNA polymerase sigma factor (sigma-70 family)